MFHHPMTSHGASRNPLAAYVRTGLDARVADADPHALVAMLFDGLFESLAQARGTNAARSLSQPSKSLAVIALGAFINGCAGSRTLTAALSLVKRSSESVRANGANGARNRLKSLAPCAITIRVPPACA